ncbi:ribonuclease E activity regulator RraA [Cupriavidus necator]
MKSTRTAFTSDLADLHGDRVRGYSSPFTSYGGRVAFHGAIETIRCFEDPSLIRACLAEPGHGRVLVVDAGGSRRVALLGDKMARLGCDNGWAGVILHGAIRDRLALAEVDFGVFALGAVPVRGENRGTGERTARLEIQGIPFLRGSHVYCDADGILIAETALDPGA